MALTVIDTNYFSGLSNITPDPDAHKELADIIIDLQNAVNAMGGGDVEFQQGTATIPDPDDNIVVTFPTAFTKTNFGVVATAEKNVNVFTDAPSATQVTLKLSAGALGTDTDVHWFAFSW